MKNLFLNGDIIFIIVGVVVFLIIVVILWYISVMNTLRRLEVSVNEAMSGIDVALEKRFDSLTKLLDTTKGYAKHEAETLENVVKWRSGIPQNASVAEKQEFAESLNNLASGLNIVVEKYPELKANDMFNNLQKSIVDTEEHLQAARRLYNSNVRIINQKIVTFPVSFVANKIGMKQKEFFETQEAKRQDPKMTF